MSEYQNYPVLTPNKTHFAFVTQELPAESGSGRSPVYKTTFDVRTLDDYSQGRVKPQTSSSSSDEEHLVKLLSYPAPVAIQNDTAYRHGSELENDDKRHPERGHRIDLNSVPSWRRPQVESSYVRNSSRFGRYK
jgi:hypothetical protein